MFHVEQTGNFQRGTVSAQSIQRSDLSPDQAEVFDKILAWHRDPNARQYLKVAGYAGTGKTTLVAALAKHLESIGETIAYTAFTGKAVNVMSKKLRSAGVDGFYATLHALMYRPETSEDGKIKGWVKTDSLPYSLIIVDEASMVGSELWEDLLSFRIPVIAVGDHGQLPPVGDNVVNLMQTPDLRLEKIHRQAEGNPILAFAQWVREGKPYGKFEPSDSRVTFIDSVARIAPKLQQADLLNFGAICYTNRTRASLNRFIRTQKGINSPYPVSGDVVICLKNKKPVFNGMRGFLSHGGEPLDSDFYDNFVGQVDFTDDGLLLRSTMHFPQFGLPKTLDDLNALRTKYNNPSLTWNNIGMLFDYGYALTCHKAQGSQFKDVVIVYENLFRDSDTRNRWLYTAGTRASEQLYLVKA